MEIVQYLCEFFFTNFWHWLGLLMIVGALCPSHKIVIKRKD